MRSRLSIFKSAFIGAAAILVTAAAAQASIELSVDASCPDGGPITISWSGATPHGHISILFGRREGSTVIPTGNSCAGTTLAIQGKVREVIEGLTGSSGNAMIMGEARRGACNGFMQLVDLENCATSNTAQLQ